MLEIPTTKTHAILRMLTSPSNRVNLFSGSKQSIEPKPPTCSHRLSKLHNPWSNRFRQPPKFVRKHPIDNLKSIQGPRINTQFFHLFNSEKEPRLEIVPEFMFAFNDDEVYDVHSAQIIYSQGDPS